MSRLAQPDDTTPTEEAFLVRSDDDALVCIEHQARAAPGQLGDLGMLLIVGGPQYRVGSHRQFVLLARRIAAAGFPVLRFDSAGMGDSSGGLLSFEHTSGNIADVIQAWRARSPHLRRFALWGLCDGASAALLYLSRRSDPAVFGVALLNPWVRSAHVQERTQVKHYYTQRLREPEFWLKLLRGGVRPAALAEFAGKLWRARKRSRAAPPLSYQERMAAGLEPLAARALLILSGNDYTAKEFIEYSTHSERWQRALAAVQRVDLGEADHTFSSAAWRAAVEDATVRWLGTLAGNATQG